MTAVRRMVLLSIATSLATIVLKFSAWYVTRSVSLWSDALEALVNLAAGLVALGAITLAHQPADDRHRFGHDKAEYFSSGAEGTLILVAAATIVYAAVGRFLAPSPLTDLGPGLLVAAAAAGVNWVVATVMLRVGQQYDSITIEADAHHLMTDVWTSIGIVGGLLVVLWKPEWAVLDPVMALIVALHILVTGFDLLRRSADGLMDTALPDAEVQEAEAAIAATLPPKASFHALRTRKAGSRRFLELHLTVPGMTTVAESHALCDRVEAALQVALPRAVVTVHVEPRETQEPHA